MKRSHAANGTPSVQRRPPSPGRRLWGLAALACAAVLIALLWAMAGKFASQRRVAAEDSGAEDAMRQIFGAGAETSVQDPARQSGAVPLIQGAEPSVQSCAARPLALSGEPEPFPYFDDLRAQNQDIAGLIDVNGRSMYVCQGSDNLYYMSHRFDRTQDAAGMIFLDCRCAIWPASDNLILYGHNMRDGSRFGELKRYLEPDYLARHPSLRFATLYELGDYVPFAILLTSADEDAPEYFDWARTNFTGPEDFDAFVSEAKARSAIELPEEPVYGDRLLTLVTCSSALEDGRLVMLCKAVDAAEESGIM